MTDLDIARAVTPEDIVDLARQRLGIAPQFIEPWGHHKAKLSEKLALELADAEDGKLILVSAMTPTPAGEGKTTTTIGLADALAGLGKKTIICLRQPSMGPSFGVKGGATGGGRAQIIPMEDINLHFTGDFHAVCAANNLLAALVDNHIHHGNKLGIDPRRVTWKRVIDLNDRALRNITIGLGGPAHGQPREDGFAIAAASEVMAILCLAESLHELRERFGQIIIGYDFDRAPVFARDLNAHGAMTVLMKDAIKPNLVQSLEGTPALIHGGPFANIAHGCNSVIATKLALKLADYVVTEAGFGADLGAEKFINIKCRKAGLRPAAVVLVATIRALKHVGGAQDAGDDLAALNAGLQNLRRHVRIVRDVYGLPLVVALNRFATDTAEELTLVEDAIKGEAPIHVADHWARGGDGATELANALLSLTDGSSPAELRFTYEDSDPFWSKIDQVAKKVYGASEVTGDKRVRDKVRRLQDDGHGAYPICIVKTQYSFSTDPKLRGAINGHVFHVRDVYLANGAGFLVVLTGEVMTMPGLPRHPAAEGIDIDANGQIVGLI